MKDIYGNKVEEGDWIQGYNNKKYAADTTKLYPTNPMKMPEHLGDTFEYNHTTGTYWIWKLNIRTDPIENPFL